MKKTFPCWVCKGQGGDTEYIDGYHYQSWSCAYCRGEGLIEIGGPTHFENSKEKAVNDLVAALWRWIPESQWEDSYKFAREAVAEILEKLDINSPKTNQS